MPVTLLPVRLETRYIGIADAPTELRIRVYPDQVHVDAHQPRLTDGEIAAGHGLLAQPLGRRRRTRPPTAAAGVGASSSAGSGRRAPRRSCAR